MGHVQDVQDQLSQALEIGAALSSSLELDEVLSTIARELTELFDVWECDVYEYRPREGRLVATALWSREVRAADRAWIGRAIDIADRPAYRRLLETGGVAEFQRDDLEVDPAHLREMERWDEQTSVCAPLVFGDQVIGLLTLVEKRAPRHFSDDERRLLARLALPAAVGECAIDAYDSQTETITVVAYYQRWPAEDGDAWLGRSYALADFPGDRAILSSGRIAEEHVSDPTLDEANRRSMIENDEKTVLSVPLVVDGRPIGLLVFVETETERHFTREEREIAAALGEQAAIAMRNAQMMRRLEEQNRRLDSLVRSTRAITSSVDLEEVLDTVARTAAAALDCQQCQIQEFDASANTVTVAAAFAVDGDPSAYESLHKTFSLDDEPEERAIIENKVPVEQIASDPGVTPGAKGSFDKFGDKAYLNVPLVFNGEPYGVLVLIETERERRFTPAEVELAEALAEQAAVAIEHARLYRLSERRAITDGLTGLYNHRYFYDRLTQEVARSRRYGAPVSLLMIDIDDFKSFNDTRGHVAGDEVLRGVAGILNSALRRDVDIAARYGGEELAVILPNTPMDGAADPQFAMPVPVSAGGDGRESPLDPAPGNRDGAAAVAERIRGRFERASLARVLGQLETQLTVSIGVASFPGQSDSLEDLVRNADSALYKAKRAGKNRVETFG